MKNLLWLCCLVVLTRTSLQDMVATTGLPTSSSSGGEDQNLPKPEMYSLHVVSNISHRFARTGVVSRLANPANKAQEVYFTMVLPETAFISGFNMEVDGKVYEAYVKEKEEAKQEYDQAVASGQTAAHVAVSARDSNTFSVSVNVEPSKKVTFNLTYEELLTRKLGIYTQAINFNPGQTVRDLQVDVYIVESRNITTLRVPEFRTGNEIDADEANKSNSLAKIERTAENKAHIHFAPTIEQQKEIAAKKKAEEENKDADKGLAGQFVVQYDVERDPQGGEVLVNEGYFVHFFAPSDLPPLHKHVIFVLDVSGSMEGRKVEQLKEAMQTILDDLHPGDYFNLLEFSYSVTVWNLDSASANLVYSPYNYNNNEQTVLGTIPAFPATPEYIKKAKDVVSKMTAGGGTNIHDALKTAINVVHTGFENVTLNGSKPEPIIVFLTDGEPTVGETRPQKLHALVSEMNNDPSAAIFSLAFGDDADFGFLKKLSLRNDGFARKIYEAADATLQLRDFYKQVASPLLSNVTFKYDPDKVDSTSVTRKYFPIFFLGSEMVVAGKLADKDDTSGLSAEVSGQAISGDTSFPVVNYKPFPEIKYMIQEREVSPLEKLWAYMSIHQLLDVVEVNNEDVQSFPFDDSKNKTEAELDAKNKTEDAKKKALELALKYKFVTKLTSLVVVKPNETTSAGLEASKPAGNNRNHFYSFSAVPMAGAFPMGGGQHSSGIPLIVGGQPAPPSRYPGAPGYPGQPGRPGSTPPPLGGFWGGPAMLTTTLPPSAYQTTNRPDAIAPDNTSSSLTPKLASLNDLTWLAEASNGTDNVSVPFANGTEIYKLGLDEDNVEGQLCSFPDPVVSGSSHCRHLPHCVLTSIVSDVHEYAKYFCHIGDFAGVCCPDELQQQTSSPSLEPSSSASPAA